MITLPGIVRILLLVSETNQRTQPPTHSRLYTCRLILHRERLGKVRMQFGER